MAQTAAVRIASDGDAIDYTPTSAVVAGDVVQIGTIPLVATSAIAANTLGALASEGIFDVPKTSDVFAVGDAVYWNSSGTPVTGDALSGAADNATGNVMGVCVTNANAAVSYVRVKLTAAKRTNTIAGSVTADDITGSDSSLAITGVSGATANTGGAVAIAGGAGGSTNGLGGAVTVIGGAATNNNDNGGAVTIDGGAAHGTGTAGVVTIGTNASSVVFGKMPRMPVTLVNANGGNIATAGTLVAGFNKVAAADNSKGVILPSCADGRWVVITSQTTDKTLKIYPPSGKQVNGAGANNAITLVANGTAMFWSEGTNAYYGGLFSGIMS